MKKIYFLILAFCFFNGLRAQIINFPDANFKKALFLSEGANIYNALDQFGNKIYDIDANGNREFEISEVQRIYELDLDSANITDLTGIEHFTNLQTLNCNYNQISQLDVTKLIKLKTLRCGVNKIINLKVNGLSNLEVLNCGGNLLPSIDFKNCDKLKLLIVNENQFTNLSLKDLKSLEILRLENNSLLTSLDITNCELLQGLWVYNCSLNVLNFGNNKKLTSLFCGKNKLQILDISNTSVTTLHCERNDFLKTLILKNGKFIEEDNIEFTNCPNLRYICVDDIQYNSITNKIRSYFYYSSYLNCNINTYCSFTPGGDYYSAHGNVKWDRDNNGCDENDAFCSNVKFNITDGTNNGQFISNYTGNYFMPLQVGNYTITPVIENFSYFVVNPKSINVIFPNQTNDFIQDFCVQANGIHPDLEIVLLPLEAARPGFDTKYKIVFKNKGNQTQSGSVNLTFDDAILDFISASPVATTQKVNSLSWNFTNLKPFESKEITFTLNVNSPMEIPAVNNGDLLKFVATITSHGPDETPIDNAFTLNQTVVGSYDPNDKTCLEGNKIKPDLIGQYVHYMIRFENTGTYAAQNIVVKDMIDLAKFDISSLIPTTSSHSFVTKISDDNKVEFIFENINLPFDDANNDGYVAFKIKTLPTLKVGDSFSNDASIYFDYNFPIVTNKATSKIETTLNIQDFDFSNYFSLYPNPVNEELNIIAKQNIELQSLTIYDILGQVVIAFPNAKSGSKIDVSKLSSGNYFVKVKSDKGIASMKFIKN